MLSSQFYTFLFESDAPMMTMLSGFSFWLNTVKTYVIIWNYDLYLEVRTVNTCVCVCIGCQNDECPALSVLPARICHPLPYLLIIQSRTWKERSWICAYQTVLVIKVMMMTMMC